MRDTFPKGHGLSTSVADGLVYRSEGAVSLSDVQYLALESGVAQGQSMLVVSPTSTGKTQIGLWAIAEGLLAGNKTVYLVTHRALAKQKFEDFKSLLLNRYLGGDDASMVIATGDYVEDASGQYSAAPLSAPVVIATYEKYLALLSASGVPKSMQNTVVVCDEIQLLGDENRGQNVEVLLTLMKNAGWRQFVGLSAVLKNKDAQDLANWLSVKLILEQKREKHLRYECWIGDQIYSVSSANPDVIESDKRLPIGVKAETISALTYLLTQKNPPLPIIVFCMKKQDTYDLAEAFVSSYHKGKQGQLSLEFETLPETSANNMLAKILDLRVASHNADLTDDERGVVERYLSENKLDVVFATSTLAAGVNFPLGAAVFASWQRWDGQQRQYVAIESAEFHNMSGRVGRMGFGHAEGRVIYFGTGQPRALATSYLSIGQMPEIKARISPTRFGQLSLQLISSGLCNNRAELEGLICTTFSALREEDNNLTAFKSWPSKIAAALSDLIDAGFVAETFDGELTTTPVGRAVGFSGLLPETGMFLLNFISKKSANLAGLIGQLDSPDQKSRLEMLVFSACLSSPEFRPRNGVKPTRLLPYQLKDIFYDAQHLADDLMEPRWQVDPMPTNAAWLCQKWTSGVEIRAIELEVNSLSAGAVTEMNRNLSWVLQGLAGIAMSASDKRVPSVLRPPQLRIDDASLSAISKLTRYIRRLAYRVQEGLPDDILWMTGVSPAGSTFKLYRHEMLLLKKHGVTTPQLLMLGSPEANTARLLAFVKAKPNAQAKANWVRDACRAWKVEQRRRMSIRHLKRASRCENKMLIETYYDAKGDAFEVAFEQVLGKLGVAFEKLDDKTKTGAPDYLLKFADSPPVVVELKSKEGDKLVDYNKAIEVLAASEIHGFRDYYCVTLCHPGVDPSVPQQIAACGRLSVIESGDLGEALLRLCEKNLTQQQLWQWLCTPGQAVAEDLPFRLYN
ncbi:DEAD/DEAH box helicase [Pseudomonas fuscovaginae UPB0736]|uniref:DEAD/DEAH box helicase n=1 Tax=Pseudomonas asplenii TaxID=53407 RepID=UPI00028880A8|nr:DEAD/DEAH box helicase [Pseudomonas fuscovaginae]UUQ64503.1 DEAD/DEAH box helicase [Pseudomonas fuscovaginae UPB0736]